MSSLPRESRLCMTLIGVRVVPATTNEGSHRVNVPLGWVVMQIYNQQLWVAIAHWYLFTSLCSRLDLLFDCYKHFLFEIIRLNIVKLILKFWFAPWAQKMVVFFSFNCFGFCSELVQGSQLLCLWPNNIANPLGTNSSNTDSSKAVLIQVGWPF